MNNVLEMMPMSIAQNLMENTYNDSLNNLEKSNNNKIKYAKKIKYSFEQWCIDNNRQDVLLRWDYEKNTCLPSDIESKSETKRWFTCPDNIHQSELHKISNLPYGKQKDFFCKKCNSFAQYVINNYGEDALEKIWSKENKLSPWDVPRGSKKKYQLIDLKTGKLKYISPCKYLDKSPKYIADEHSVVDGKSLGDIYPQSIDVWSDKNNQTPFDFHCSSNTSVWWKCENGKHDDYKRIIASSKIRDFRCPKCGRLGKGLIDLKGEKFGLLTVMKFDKSEDGVPYWLCKCECGKTVSVRGILLRIGRAKTCGDGIHRTGENNPFWKGGNKTEGQKLRSSGEYKHWRKDVLNNQNNICQVSLKKTDNPNIHHIFPVSQYPELVFERWNGIVIDKIYHHMHIKGSFHHVYGAKNNTPRQIEEYINAKRKDIGIEQHFDLVEFLVNNGCPSEYINKIDNNLECNLC